jgi:hypothetical protein
MAVLIAKGGTALENDGCRAIISLLVNKKNFGREK